MQDWCAIDADDTAAVDALVQLAFGELQAASHPSMCEPADFQARVQRLLEERAQQHDEGDRPVITYEVFCGRSSCARGGSRAIRTSGLEWHGFVVASAGPNGTSRGSRSFFSTAAWAGKATGESTPFHSRCM